MTLPMVLIATKDDFGITKGTVYEILEVEEFEYSTMFWFYDDDLRLTYAMKVHNYEPVGFEVYHQLQL